MEIDHLERIFGALQTANVRYLVVGGLAVIAHGYLRYTNDIDLVVAFERNNLATAMAVLKELGYRPKAPVNALDFADPEKRRQWVEEKGMVVFQLVSENFTREPIDVFVSAPFDVEAAYACCEWRDVAPTLRVPVVSLSALLDMKRSASRSTDLIDVEKLLQLQRFRDEQRNQS